MAALKLALAGAPGTGAIEFASVLDGAVKASGWTTAVMVVSSDSPPRPADLAGFDLVLLMGLEPTAPAASAPGNTAAFILAQEAADQAVRAALAHAAMSYQVLYGTSAQRLDQALLAMQSLLPRAEAGPRLIAGASRVKNLPWVWLCDKCSDPQCEHRLLTALLAQRASTD